ncbi:MAG: DUF2817 domain-containing protein [Oligoflexia bacterium]|nr:DUF2817 domain-containing protein [Oligoflexia bacterium]
MMETLSHTIELPSKIHHFPTHHNLGNSVLGTPIGYFTVGHGSKQILIMSGLHGDEFEAQILLDAIFRELITTQHFARYFESWTIAILPVANPDGAHLRQRWNANLVDLNRNFPTKDWNPAPLKPRYTPGPAPASEPETKNIITLIKGHRPILVLDIHSFQTSAVLPCLPSKNRFPCDGDLLDHLIKRLAHNLHVPIGDEVLGYETAGGKHTWCQEQGIPEITLEVKRNINHQEIVERYLGPTILFLDDFLHA